MDKIIEQLLKLSDAQLDGSMRPYLEKFDNPPKAIQLLEVLDLCVHGSLASSFVIITLDILLKDSIEREGTTYEEVVKQASWRKIPKNG